MSSAEKGGGGYFREDIYVNLPYSVHLHPPPPPPPAPRSTPRYCTGFL